MEVSSHPGVTASATPTTWRRPPPASPSSSRPSPPDAPTGLPPLTRPKPDAPDTPDVPGASRRSGVLTLPLPGGGHGRARQGHGRDDPAAGRVAQLDRPARLLDGLGDDGQAEPGSRQRPGRRRAPEPLEHV